MVNMALLPGAIVLAGLKLPSKNCEAPVPVRLRLDIARDPVPVFFTVIVMAPELFPAS